jgi:hypothetical protein
MSAFRPKINPKLKGGAQRARAARELATMRRMIANGTSEKLAYQIIAAKRARREAKRKEAADNA